ncbi:hypothetical protein H6F43_05110 [Leptolyngbya sp. FACHB-36]|uniref:hypothetical protein n=1 Tax=Leptolyngbya sp. FACHB-36 TaxID=2692808 RepID=UPI001680FB19|nr:hypothetical protein [Leptolyngbya sp. FACHB-36]MBD2019563.1 hypothetical protein [Leptolyngbya sp. FACHB-36]
MVRESAQVSCSPQAGQLENFRILGSRDWANGKSVVYQATCRNNSSKPSLAIVGYSMFERHGLNWSPAGGGSAGSPLNASSPQKLAQFVASQSTNQGNRYAAVHGQILSPQVATIEAQFSNGKLLRDDGNGEMFAIVEAGATRVCQVRLLGANGQVLQRHQVGSEAKSSTCPT